MHKIQSFLSQYIQILKTYLSNLTKTAQHHITNAQRQYKTKYDSHRSNPTYKVGDAVLIRSHFPRHKFDIRHEGPFRIVQHLAFKTYVVQHIKNTDLIRQVTVDSIVPLFDRTF
jgi:hypothetical protein